MAVGLLAYRARAAFSTVSATSRALNFSDSTMTSTLPPEPNDAADSEPLGAREPVPGESIPRGPTKRAPRPRTPAEQVAFLSRLAGGLAHEIKNPLSTMAINLALLEEEWTRVAGARSAKEPELTPRD